jgi:hypothetical protein
MAEKEIVQICISHQKFGTISKLYSRQKSNQEMQLYLVPSDRLLAFNCIRAANDFLTFFYGVKKL